MKLPGLRLQLFRCHSRLVEQGVISDRDGQKPINDNGSNNLLNRLNLPAPCRGRVEKMP